MESATNNIDSALRKARYNEIVEVSIKIPFSTTNNNKDGDDDGNNESKEEGHNEQVISLVPSLDECHGGIQWNTLQENDDGENQNLLLSRHLQTKKWIFPMLNDTYRNQLYKDAIDAASKLIVEQRSMLRDNTSNINNETILDASFSDSSVINILDIGCGTGLLGMLAVQAFQKLGIHDSCIRVTAIEMSSAMVNIAKHTIADNQMDHIITVLEGHSCHLELPYKYDLCLSELLEDGLLGEGIIPTIRDAWERHLHPHTIMIPSKCNVYAQLMSGEWISQYSPNFRRSINHSNGAVNTDSDAVDEQIYFCFDDDNNTTERDNNYTIDKNDKHNSIIMDDAGQIEGSRYHHHLQRQQIAIPIHASKLLEQHTLQAISDSAQVLSISFEHGQLPTSSSNVINTTSFLIRNINEDDKVVPVMTIHGVLIWWELELFPGIRTYFTHHDYDATNYQKYQQQPFQDHWHPCLHVLDDPIPITMFECSSGHDNLQNVGITISHDDYRIYIVDVVTTPKKTIAAIYDDHNDNVNKETVSQQQLLEEQSCDQPSAFCPNKRIKQSILTLPHKDPMNISTDSVLFSPDRRYQLNDPVRFDLWKNWIELAIQKLVQQKRPQHQAKDNHTSLTNLVVLDVSDFCYCGIIAGSYDHVQTVLSIENSSGSLPSLAARVMTTCSTSKMKQTQQQTIDKTNASGIKSTSSVSSPSTNTTVYEVIQCHNEDITLDVLLKLTTNDIGKEETNRRKREIDIIVAEPYYEMLEGWHLQEALNFYYTVRYLRSKSCNIVQNNTIILPGLCRVMGCIIECTELRMSYRPCGDIVVPCSSSINDTAKHNTIFGIDHTYVNRIGGTRFHTFDISLPINEYHYKVLTESVELIRLDYDSTNDCDGNNKTNTSNVSSANLSTSTPQQQVLTNKVYGTFHTSGTCDALLVWLEYHFLPSSTTIPSSCCSFVSTLDNGRCYKQCVRMLPSPVNVDNIKEKCFECTTTLGKSIGSSVDHDFWVDIVNNARENKRH